jgi:transcriptional regulator of nitric oxide reductase
MHPPRLALGVALALVLSAPGRLTAQAAAPARVAASVRRVFGTDVRIDSVSLDSASVLRISKADTVLGFAQVRNVRGKDQPITYLVAVDAAGRLRDVDILVYREPYGGEVAYEAWRKQFRGKGPDAPLVVGRDIQGISGATISVNAVTLGVRRAVADFAAWRGSGRLR